MTDKAAVSSANPKKTRLLCVVGPTASGKSALAVALAKRLRGEVVSCDSMQVYRRMNIGTAKPTWEETEGIAHHMIDVAEPSRSFSCAEYVSLASEVIEKITARGALPILCGGTGLYLDSLLRGGFSEAEADPQIRERLFAIARECGNAELHRMLEAVDPESAAAIHENNVKRVVRALEIYESTGMTKTESDRRSREAEGPYNAVVIGLRYPDRELLYSRIEKRVDRMMTDGLLAETRALLAEGIFSENSTAAQAIGYKELLGVLDGRQSLEAAVEELKTATRRYAKRQMTWFGAKPYVHWIDMANGQQMRSPGEILGEALSVWQNAATTDGSVGMIGGTA
ncbi:MAG: tRNA (adenosine(37)-N6)-dimethylallyltransferase MiaA [Ruminococcaceae bacterium]|nr:tRNA (adenosine(37)-N6)-dimethylallyltransferase MiaA [Oscillospiraceae bacterium]